jgi:hypothetical protein
MERNRRRFLLLVSACIAIACTPGGGGSRSDSTAPTASLNSDQATSFTVANRTSVALTVFWLDFQGQRVKYFDLAPGAAQQQATFRHASLGGGRLLRHLRQILPGDRAGADHGRLT